MRGSSQVFGPWAARLAIAVVIAIVVARSSASTQAIAGAVVAAALVLWVVWRVRRPRIRDWRDAETATARWLRKAGCRRVGLTANSADGGIDVLTANWAVQVKHTSKRVGRPAVQQLVGAALDVDRAPALFSTSGFTAPGIAYAEQHDVALLELRLDGSARRVNAPARKIGKRRVRS